jgi:hypothetical protein
MPCPQPHVRQWCVARHLLSSRLADSTPYLTGPRRLAIRWQTFHQRKAKSALCCAPSLRGMSHRRGDPERLQGQAVRYHTVSNGACKYWQ